MAAKDLPTERTCGAMEVHERLLRTVPEYAAARAASETRAWEVEALGAEVARTGVTVIPVVVHVVYKTNAQNISDPQIKSQIDVLNRDFRMTNPDISSLPAVFQPLAADARIEFELATSDPQGNQTDGITRTQTNAAGVLERRRVKSAASGGADGWPADKLPQPLGLPARTRQPPRVRPVPRRPGCNRRCRHPAHRLRDHRDRGGTRSTWAEPRRTRSAIG